MVLENIKSKKKHSQNKIKIKWKVTPLIRRGGNICFFAALYALFLALIPCLPSWQRKEAIRALKPSKEHKVLQRKKCLFSMDLIIKMMLRRELKFTSSAWKLTSSGWKWYYSFSREILNICLNQPHTSNSNLWV